MQAELTIPNFELDEEIGRGGMARVYLARQLQPSRKVAVKVVSPGGVAADPAFLQSLKQEGDTVAQFSHNNIVTVYACGVIDNHYYLAMEILDGGDLKSRIRKGLKVDESLTILEEMASALEHAHAHNTLHRDIKPENILFHKSGKAVLVDFGIAKDQDSESNFTKAGAIVGTPHYMAPERSQGKDVDHRSDIYALGAVFFEMLTGRKMYLGSDTFAISYAHIYEAIPKLPPELARFQSLFEKMVAKAPVDRYQSAAELLKAIASTKALPEDKPAPAPMVTEETIVVPDPLRAADERKAKSAADETEVHDSGSVGPVTKSKAPLAVGGFVFVAAISAFAIWQFGGSDSTELPNSTSAQLTMEQKRRMADLLDAARGFENIDRMEEAEARYAQVLEEYDCKNREARSGLQIHNEQRYNEIVTSCDSN